MPSLIFAQAITSSCVLPRSASTLHPQHARKGWVCPLDAVVGAQDQDAIRRGIQQGVQALALLVNLGVQLGVVHRNRRLVGKALQQRSIIGGKRASVVAENEQNPAYLVAGDQRQRHAGQQAQAGGACDHLQQAVDLGQLVARRLFVLADARQQLLELAQEPRRNALRDADLPAALASRKAIRPACPASISIEISRMRASSTSRFSS